MIKAFLGTGLLGAAFTRAMLQRGDKVQVWNRTAARAQALEVYGARALATAAEAVAGAACIHVAVKDDASVDEVLQSARSGFIPGAIIIDHTTTSKAGAIARSAYWKDQGFAYQHAPVFMGPANALDASGFMLVSGEEALVAQLRPHLAPMTGTLLDLGPETGKAAATKLAGNAFLVCFTFGLREALAVGKANGLAPEDLACLLASWNPATQTDARLKKLSGTDHHQPSWELAMARKDTQLFLDAAAGAGIGLTLLPVIAQMMDEWIAKGLGNHDWTVVGRQEPGPAV